MMKSQDIKPSVPSRLGIGPMSRNVLDTAIDLAYRSGRRIMLIPSRRQVDREDLGGGYVERWSTEQFASYVRSRDPAHLLMLCRDHGGPWQHPNELADGLNEAEAMASSLASFRYDIAAGFEMLHIDTCQDAHGPADLESAVGRLVTLYGECQEAANTAGLQVRFEVGFEEQSPEADAPDYFRAKITYLWEMLAKEKLPPPVFVVAQTGTKVIGAANRGALVDRPDTIGKTVRALTRVCWDFGVALKAHNVDYLPGHSVQYLIRNGVGAVNVAPEFGVVETKAFLALLDRLNLPRLRDLFLHLSYQSGSWRKWLEDGVSVTDLECSILAGHYVFSTDTFREIKEQADTVCRKYATTVDEHLRQALEHSIQRHLSNVWIN